MARPKWACQALAKGAMGVGVPYLKVKTCAYREGGGPTPVPPHGVHNPSPRLDGAPLACSSQAVVHVVVHVAVHFFGTALAECTARATNKERGRLAQGLQGTRKWHEPCRARRERGGGRPPGTALAGDNGELVCHNAQGHRTQDADSPTHNAQRGYSDYYGG